MISCCCDASAIQVRICSATVKCVFARMGFLSSSVTSIVTEEEIVRGVMMRSLRTLLAGLQPALRKGRMRGNLALRQGVNSSGTAGEQDHKGCMTGGAPTGV